MCVFVFQVTGAQYCRAHMDALHAASTYRCLLTSTRMHLQLHQVYHARGERDQEQMARLVGLQLPTQPGGKGWETWRLRMRISVDYKISLWKSIIKSQFMKSQHPFPPWFHPLTELCDLCAFPFHVGFLQSNSKSTIFFVCVYSCQRQPNNKCFSNYNAQLLPTFSRDYQYNTCGFLLLQHCVMLFKSHGWMESLPKKNCI